MKKKKELPEETRQAIRFSKIITLVIAFIMVFLLLFPFLMVTNKEDGTKIYGAFLYQIVVWNKPTEHNGQTGIYHHTSLYLFPRNLWSIDEQWNVSMNNFREEDFIPIQQGEKP